MQAPRFANCTPVGVSDEPVFCTRENEVGSARRVPRVLVRYLLPDSSYTLLSLDAAPARNLRGFIGQQPVDTDGTASPPQSKAGT
jgi:hypothetical protein